MQTEEVDNAKPIPEPILSNVLNFIKKSKVPADCEIFFRDGAQYGYTIAQVFVEDLKNEMIEINSRFKTIVDQKNAEIEALNFQISGLKIPPLSDDD